MKASRVVRSSTLAEFFSSNLLDGHKYIHVSLFGYFAEAANTGVRFGNHTCANWTASNDTGHGRMEIHWKDGRCPNKEGKQHDNPVKIFSRRTRPSEST